MLSLFEHETQPLTTYQLDTLVPAIIRGMKCHYGKERAITSAKIVKLMVGHGYKISDVTLRRCIKHIQTHNLLTWIIAGENGFYYSRDPDEVKKQIESLRGREEAIRSVRESLEHSLNIQHLT